MIATSPLQRVAGQPPCDSRCESVVLNGMFAVPARMAQYDLGPHLYFPEHQAIWCAMARVAAGEPDLFWWRTFKELQRERPTAEVWRLLSVLEWLPFMTVGDTDDGCVLFMLALRNIQRCTVVRAESPTVRPAQVTQLRRVSRREWSA